EWNLVTSHDEKSMEKPLKNQSVAPAKPASNKPDCLIRLVSSIATLAIFGFFFSTGPLSCILSIILLLSMSYYEQIKIGLSSAK
ncbi:MAG: hypothetical protein MHPSP_003619, partial [Paramarteilia canceri]